jgi:hypothetical protein
MMRPQIIERFQYNFITYGCEIETKDIDRGCITTKFGK